MAIVVVHHGQGCPCHDRVVGTSGAGPGRTLFGPTIERKNGFAEKNKNLRSCMQDGVASTTVAFGLNWMAWG